MGRKAITVTLLTGLAFGILQVWIKTSNPTFALTHWFNDMTYYIKEGFVILVEDLHFAPGEGRAMFASLAMGAAEHRILLLGTAFIILLGRTFAGVFLTSWVPDAVSGFRIEIEYLVAVFRQ